MRGWSVVYDGVRSLDLTATAADRLHRRGVIVPHPGAGRGGITAGDWALAPGATWEHVEAERDHESALWRQDARP